MCMTAVATLGTLVGTYILSKIASGDHLLHQLLGRCFVQYFISQNHRGLSSW